MEMLLNVVEIALDLVIIAVILRIKGGMDE